MTIKTKGQKRKGRARVFVFLCFAASTLVGMHYMSGIFNAAYAWVSSPGEATGVIVDHYSEMEEYRTRKGRKRTSEHYYADYEFSVDDELYSGVMEITSDEYDSMSAGDEFALWFDPEYPYENLPADEARDAAQGANSIDMFLMVAPYTGPACLFLLFLINFVYVRESGDKLADGFYTEMSWLDVDDNMLVWIQSDSLLYASFDDSQGAQIQKTFQSGEAPAIAVAGAKVKKIVQIKLSEVASLNSTSDADTLRIGVGEDRHTLEFLNAGFKAHAMERIEPLLPKSLVKTERQYSRLGSAAWHLTWLLLIVAAGLWLGSLVLQVLLGLFALIKIVPGLIRRLRRPISRTSYAISEVSDEMDVDGPVVA